MTHFPKPRARDLGVPLPGTPDALNALADVPGIEVGAAEDVPLARPAEGICRALDTGQLMALLADADAGGR